MKPLISLDKTHLAFGLQPLLDDTSLTISPSERICLIGRNGAGKSSLLKLIEGTLMPDGGGIWRKPGLRIARLSQELPQKTNCTLYEYVAGGLPEAGKLLSEYHTLTHNLSTTSSQQDLDQLGRLQKKIDACDAWQFDQQIQEVLTRLELDPDKTLDALSGGWQRRAALAKALVVSPELLLLDEPTNHLDLEAIKWLEEKLLSFNVGLVFITHDRAFLQRLATRIIELDRGNLTSWPGDYANFLARKEEMLRAEEIHNKEFDKKLAQEEKWIRQGVKARRTRNEGRVRALKALRLERGKRREQQGKANFKIQEQEKSGKLVIEAKNITHGYNDKTLIHDFSIRIIRGDKIGLVGPNGIGKTTLLNILLENTTPQQGTVKHGTKLKIAYFDQLRAKLDPEKTVIDNLSHGSDEIEVNGKSKHVMSYLSDFLFTPERSRTPVKALSGGECNRLLLARLFIQPANLLILDEPTNDLDIETLELLEELLSDYQGTLLLVSHDRAFLDNVVTSTIAFEGDGIVKEYIGGYNDWLRQKSKPTEPGVKKTAQKPQQEKPKNPKKLSFTEQKEMSELPKKIEALEKEQTALQATIADNDFYQQDQAIITKTLEKLNAIDKTLDAAYQRWETLENCIASNDKL